MSETNFFNVNAVAASHVAIAQCVEAFARLPDTAPKRDRSAFATILDDQFRELFRDGYGLTPEEQDHLKWIWDALRRTLRSPTLEKFEPKQVKTS